MKLLMQFYVIACFINEGMFKCVHMFGDTEEERNKRKTQEARAWFDFIQSSNIGCHTNVKEDWDRPEGLLQSVMWC